MEHTAKGNHKILKECTLPLTAAGEVDMIITEMGVMNVTPEGIELVELNPEFTLDDIKAATGCELIISKNLKSNASMTKTYIVAAKKNSDRQIFRNNSFNDSS